MPAPAKQRFIHVKAFQVVAGATVQYNTIEEVEVEKTYEELSDSGDDDAADSWVAKGKMSVRFTITIKDPVQADALGDQPAGIMSFQAFDPVGAKTLTVTITGATFFGSRGRHKHNSVSSSSVRGRAFKPDGTNPLAVVSA